MRGPAPGPGRAGRRLGARPRGGGPLTRHRGAGLREVPEQIHPAAAPAAPPPRPLPPAQAPLRARLPAPQAANLPARPISGRGRAGSRRAARRRRRGWSGRPPLGPPPRGACQSPPGGRRGAPSNSPAGRQRGAFSANRKAGPPCQSVPLPRASLRQADQSRRGGGAGGGAQHRPAVPTNRWRGWEGARRVPGRAGRARGAPWWRQEGLRAGSRFPVPAPRATSPSRPHSGTAPSPTAPGHWGPPRCRWYRPGGTRPAHPPQEGELAGAGVFALNTTFISEPNKPHVRADGRDRRRQPPRPQGRESPGVLPWPAGSGGHEGHSLPPLQAPGLPAGARLPSMPPVPSEISLLMGLTVVRKPQVCILHPGGLWW